MIDHLPSDEVMLEGPGEDRPVPCGRLIGCAGTGKTYQLIQRTTADDTYGLLTSTTGVSAVNLGAITIHSTLKWSDTLSLRDAYLSGRLARTLHDIGLRYRRIIIEEYSMLHGDQLDLIHRGVAEANKYADMCEPLGILLVGDLAQLPPVKGPWCFTADCWQAFADNTERLDKVWRQDGGPFLDALNLLRAGRGGDASALLFEAGARWHTQLDNEFDGTTILPKNDMVNRYNSLALSRVRGKAFTVASRRWGQQRREWGENPRTHEWGIPPRLELKEGALVMVLANAADFSVVNGDTGHIVGWDEHSGVVTVKLLRTGLATAIAPIVRGVEDADPPAGQGDAAKDWPRTSDEGAEWLAQPHYRRRVRRYVTGQIQYLPLRLAYASSVHKCVAPWERIPVLGRGWIPVNQCEPGHPTPFGHLRTVTATQQPAFTVKTERGYEITCSADHRWLTERGLVETKLLTSDDRIELATIPPFPGDASVQISSEMAWWLGALIGDGCYTDKTHYTIHFANIDKFVGDRYKAYLESRGLRCEWRKDKRGLHHTSRPFRQELEEMGFDYITAPYKKIPEVIWRGGPNIWGPFLQGLFDTDGHVGRSFLVFTSASEELASNVQLMLLGLGIASKRRKFRTGYKGGHSLYWQVFIAIRGLRRFRTHVGFSHPAKAAKLQKVKAKRDILRFDGYDRIESVTNCNAFITMYDLEIDAPHMLSFGPFMGHNSQSLTLDRIQVDFRDRFFGHPAMLYVALSRCRTLEGLRLVGSRERFAQQCSTDARVTQWL